MCLSKITDQYESIPDEEGPEYGWKVFTDDGPRGLSGVYFFCRIQESRITVNTNGTWIDPKDDDREYRAGFHIFRQHCDAVALRNHLIEQSEWQRIKYDAVPESRFTIRQVSYWGEVVHGRDGGSDIIVSQNMLVHPWNLLANRISPPSRSASEVV